MLTIEDKIQEYHEQLLAKQDPGFKSFKEVPYGTSGFRGRADLIEHVLFNVGVISGLRCLQVKANIGIMITASHNPIQDNGVKLIDPKGCMLEAAWEHLVEQFCNCHDIKSIMDQLKQLISKYEIDINQEKPGKVLVGMDTRPSSEPFTELIRKGLSVWSQDLEDQNYGLLTTPALHWLVGRSNQTREREILQLEQYYESLVVAFARIEPPSTKEDQKLIIDCANGVGFETMRYLVSNQQVLDRKKLCIINDGDGTLNKNCGADYVKTSQRPPLGADDMAARYVSLDGDADRLVYFYLEEDELGSSLAPKLGPPKELKLVLLDGDKILALYIHFIRNKLVNCQLDDKLTLGVIQTPYANGASTEYIEDYLKLKVDFADTGVKNLHRLALNYDIAVYFEANGHGSIHLSHKARHLIEGRWQSDQNNGDARLLRYLLFCMNTFTGDAIANMIAVEVILDHYQWDIKDWHKLYQERPCCMIKMPVADRNVLKTTNAGQVCVEPETIQPAIDKLVSEFGQGARCFVRPSGTEDVLRIYAEAETSEKALDLGDRVSDELMKLLSIEHQ